MLELEIYIVFEVQGQGREAPLTKKKRIMQEQVQLSGNIILYSIESIGFWLNYLITVTVIFMGLLTISKNN